MIDKKLADPRDGEPKEPLLPCPNCERPINYRHFQDWQDYAAGEPIGEEYTRCKLCRKKLPEAWIDNLRDRYNRYYRKRDKYLGSVDWTDDGW